jgi:isopentenyl diphosphate isomerase/L-lactate dehydrogenase-like FMN-dependent dehydrogenase
MQQASGLAREVDGGLSVGPQVASRPLAGRLVLKGIMTPEDARRAVDHGMDAIVVSNHGGRQLDGARSTSRPCPGSPQRSAADRGLLDSGIRRGSGIVKAMASAPTAC